MLVYYVKRYYISALFEEERLTPEEPIVTLFQRFLQDDAPLFQEPLVQQSVINCVSILDRIIEMFFMDEEELGEEILEEKILDEANDKE